MYVLINIENVFTSQKLINILDIRSVYDTYLTINDNAYICLMEYCRSALSSELNISNACTLSLLHKIYMQVYNTRTYYAVL